MIFLHQSDVTPETGNCLAACIACLLEIPIEKVPDLSPSPDKCPDPKLAGGIQAMRARTWLQEHFGLTLLTVQTGNYIGVGKNTPCIAGGTSANTEGCKHAVVGIINGKGNFEMLHDPNPNGKGLVGEPDALYFLVPMELSLWARPPQFFVEMIGHLLTIIPQTSKPLKLPAGGDEDGPGKSETQGAGRERDGGNGTGSVKRRVGKRARRRDPAR
jgi:hypothetical protein